MHRMWELNVSKVSVFDIHVDFRFTVFDLYTCGPRADDVAHTLKIFTFILLLFMHVIIVALHYPLLCCIVLYSSTSYIL